MDQINPDPDPKHLRELFKRLDLQRKNEQIGLH